VKGRARASALHRERSASGIRIILEAGEARRPTRIVRRAHFAGNRTRVLLTLDRWRHEPARSVRFNRIPSRLHCQYARVNEWTRSDVLINFGRPVETAFFPRTQREVWSYRYMESNIHNMMFNFYFDQEGILRLTQRTPDPMRERNLRRF